MLICLLYFFEYFDNRVEINLMDGEIIYWCKEMAHWSKFNLVVQKIDSVFLMQVCFGFSFVFVIVVPVYLLQFIYYFSVSSYNVEVDVISKGIINLEFYKYQLGNQDYFTY